MLINKVLRTLILSLIIGIITPAITAPSTPTPQAPINITADHLFVDQLHHIAIYTGHVIADRSQAHLTGNHLTIYFNPKTHQLQRLIDIGQPATYHDIDAQSHQPLDAHAKRITLENIQHKVYLDDHAYVNKAGNIAQAPHLTYNQLTGTATSHVDHPKTQHTDILILPQTPTVASQHSTD